MIPPTDGAEKLVGSSNRHQLLESALIEHFEYAYKRGCVVWPKGFTATQRADFPVGRATARRVHNVLYKAPSFLRTDQTGQTVGLGLFSSIRYNKKEKIAQYKGEIITRAEYGEREAAGKGGYALHVSQTTVLDCYNHKAECFASAANTALGCHTKQRPAGVPLAENGLYSVRNNCKFLVSNHTPVPTVWLVAKKNIAPHTELLTPYSNAYQLPAV